MFDLQTLSIMKIFNLIFAILFLISAGLQYNDPDPYLWIPLYLLAAFLCFRAYQGRFLKLSYRIAIIIYSVYALYLFFDQNGVLSWANDHGAESLVQTMKADKPWIEETREFGGLFIMIFAISVNLIYSFRHKKMPA
jgi:Transmembrane family 220, helix